MLVLLQTRHVLHRPYCLLELLTAIDFKVPIVGGDTATAPAPSTAPSSRGARASPPLCLLLGPSPLGRCVARPSRRREPKGGREI